MVGTPDPDADELPSYAACTFIDVPEVDARLWAAFGPTGFTHIRWSDAGAGRPEWAAALPERPLPGPLVDLARYLRGEPGIEPAGLPYEATRGTPFQRRVWTALRTIPRGDVRSYGGLARDLGSPRAMRAVGQANHNNPVAVVVPCHRVVATGYGLGGYGGGLDRKRFLLTLEGVEISGGKVQPGQLGLI